MKKVLVLGALVLTIVTSMVAGTMAVYTKTIDRSGEVSTFVFDIRETQNKKIDVKLAPGYSQAWNFTLTNTTEAKGVTEVPMKVSFVVTLSEEFVNAGITAQLQLENGGVMPTVVEGDTVGGTTTFDAGKLFDAFEAKTIEGRIIFSFNDSKSAEEQSKVAGQSKPVSVKITGTQVLPSEQ